MRVKQRWPCMGSSHLHTLGVDLRRQECHRE